MKYISRARFGLLLTIGFVVSSAMFCTSSDAQDIDGFEQAKLLSAPRIIVPEEAKESGLGGKVNVLIAIDDAGKVIKIEQTSGPGMICPSATRSDVVALHKAAKDSAAKASFSPATRKGKPTKSSLWLTFDFPAAPGQNKSSFSATPVSGTLNGSAAENGGAKIPRTINGGVVNGKALKLPRPEYPPAAHAARASGAVSVKVLIIEDGTIFSAEAVSGHPLLRAAARNAACEAKFSTTRLEGNSVKVSGIITYNFVY